MDVVRFMGGLGNQMFQYAFLKSLEKKGRNVVGSLGYYKLHPDQMQYELGDVFDNVHMKTETDEEFMKSYEQWCKIKDNSKKREEFERNIENRFFWVEGVSEHGCYVPDVYSTKNCAFVGYWQSYKYFKDLNEELRSQFRFSSDDDYLTKLIKNVSSSHRYVSVHVRRGDYIKKKELYGDICNDMYYQKAVEVMKKKIVDPIFILFCDDFKWCQNQRIGNYEVIDRNCFAEYKNWYDMYIMSRCAGNIIANSSFSWWGAWQNQRRDKIVIAPSKWAHDSEYKDICPEDWIRL